MKALLNWIDDRTGIRGALHATLFEPVPGGARWRYVWGSTLTFGIVVQFITGFALWAAYSPSSQTAWESVYYIQNQMTGGWILRGIHHYTAQIMTVLLVLHLMQVLIDGAYKAPREVNFWFGVVLMLLILGLSLTGYLLPWDQKGYWATKVATSLVGVVPFIGDELQKIVVGGSEYGHHTLTRFFALHAGVLPLMVIGAIVLHVYLFRKHGLTSKKPHKKPDGMFWPDQILMDAVACLGVALCVGILTFWHHGAELTAPADPAERFPARPDWYFMFLFQFLKYFEGEALIWGGIIIPSIVMALIFAMPIIGKWKLGHVANLAFAFLLLGAFGVLTWLAYADDAGNAEFQYAKERSEIDAERVRQLASSSTGIPPVGAMTILQTDPLTQGPRIFASKCASCHQYNGHDGMGREQTEPSAPDLKGIGSREWLAGFVDPALIETEKYFFGTEFVKPDSNGRKSRMVRFVHDLAELDNEGRAELEKIVMAVSAEADLHYQEDIDERDKELIAEGVDLFFTGIKGMDSACADCHGFDGEESEAARTPSLTGWGSRDWLIQFTKNPEHSDFYGSGNDRMPVFEEEKIFTDKEIEMVVDWLREDWPRFED